MPDTASVLKIETLSPLAEKIIIDRSNFSDIYMSGKIIPLILIVLYFFFSTLRVILMKSSMKYLIVIKIARKGIRYYGVRVAKSIL